MRRLLHTDIRCQSLQAVQGSDPVGATLMSCLRACIRPVSRANPHDATRHARLRVAVQALWLLQRNRWPECRRRRHILDGRHVVCQGRRRRHRRSDAGRAPRAPRRHVQLRRAHWRVGLRSGQVRGLLCRGPAHIALPAVQVPRVRIETKMERLAQREWLHAIDGGVVASRRVRPHQVRAVQVPLGDAGRLEHGDVRGVVLDVLLEHALRHVQVQGL